MVFLLPVVVITDVLTSVAETSCELERPIAPKITLNTVNNDQSILKSNVRYLCICMLYASIFLLHWLELHDGSERLHH